MPIRPRLRAQPSIPRTTLRPVSTDSGSRALPTLRSDRVPSTQLASFGAGLAALSGALDAWAVDEEAEDLARQRKQINDLELALASQIRQASENNDPSTLDMSNIVGEFYDSERDRIIGDTLPANRDAVELLLTTVRNTALLQTVDIDMEHRRTFQMLLTDENVIGHINTVDSDPSTFPQVSRLLEREIGGLNMPISERLLLIEQKTRQVAEAAYFRRIALGESTDQADEALADYILPDRRNTLAISAMRARRVLMQQQADQVAFDLVDEARSRGSSVDQAAAVIRESDAYQNNAMLREAVRSELDAWQRDNDRTRGNARRSALEYGSRLILEGNGRVTVQSIGAENPRWLRTVSEHPDIVQELQNMQAQLARDGRFARVSTPGLLLELRSGSDEDVASRRYDTRLPLLTQREREVFGNSVLAAEEALGRASEGPGPLTAAAKTATQRRGAELLRTRLARREDLSTNNASDRRDFELLETNLRDWITYHHEQNRTPTDQEIANYVQTLLTPVDFNNNVFFRDRQGFFGTFFQVNNRGERVRSFTPEEAEAITVPFNRASLPLLRAAQRAAARRNLDPQNEDLIERIMGFLLRGDTVGLERFLGPSRSR